MLRTAGCEIADISRNSVDHSLRSIFRARAERPDHPFRTELISVGVECFSDTISVEDETIVALKRHGKIAGYPIKHVSTVNSEGHSRWLEHFHFALRGPVE